MKRLLLFTLLLSATIWLNAQPLTGTKTIPGDFATIEAAILSINTNGVGTGGVVFNVAAGHTETLSGPTKGTITTATSTTTNPITFQKSGTGDNPLVTSAVGTSASTDGIIKINGTDYVMFDGIDLHENPTNKNPTEWMEWGYALVKTGATNGCQYTIIRNCTVTLTKSNTASVGIYGGNHSATTTTQFTVASFAGTNSYNNFYNNTLSYCYKGISVTGFNAPAPYSNYDQGNEIGSYGSNTITNFGGGSVAAYGIYVKNQNNAVIANNSVNGGSGTSGILYGIYSGAASKANVTISNNEVTVAGGGTTTEVGGIGNEAGADGGSNLILIAGNRITGCTYTTATTGSFYGINNTYIYPQPAAAQIYNNVVTGNTLNGSGSYFYGIYAGNPVSLLMYADTISENQHLGTHGYMYCAYVHNSGFVFHHNIIGNNSFPVTSGSSGSAYLYGFYCTASTTNEELYDNKIFNLSMSGTYEKSSNELVGMEIAGVNSGLRSVYNNTISGLSSNLKYCSIRGLTTRWGTEVYIHHNLIHDIDYSGISRQTVGMSVQNSSNVDVYIYNNFIYDIATTIAAQVVPSLVGLYLMSGNNYVVNNTIYLNSPTLGGSYVLNASTTEPLELRNNILVNLSTATGVYETVAVAFPNNHDYYSNLSNNNCLYAGPPSGVNLICRHGGEKYTTIESFRGLVSPADQSSFSEIPPFVNTSTVPFDLHINSSIPTACESGATSMTTPFPVLDDYDGEARFPLAGYPDDPSHPATAPDIGADEFGGIPNDIIPPTISYTPLLNTAFTTDRTLVATITDASGVPVSGTGLPVLYWKINEGSYSAVPGVWTGDDHYTFTFGGGVSLNDSICYYIAAQDEAAVPNVSANKIAATAGLSANPPACLTPSSAPNYYLIKKGFEGVVTVGTGGDFFSLTQTDGLFHTLNQSHVTGNLVVNIISDLTEDGNHALNQWIEEDGTGFSVTIQPDAATTRVITGVGVESYQPMIMINGADRLTFDGGEGQNLVFRNTNATPSYTGAVFHFMTNSVDDTIQNCIIESNRTSTSSGIVHLGAVGPNQVYIQGNSIQGSTVGFTGSCGIGITSGDISNRTWIDNNQISNFNYYGIYLASVGDSCVINGNSLFNNLATPSSVGQIGIHLGSGSAHAVTNNSIGGQAALCGGDRWINNGGTTFYGISLNTGTTGVTRVDGNTISNIHLQNTGNVTFTAIKHDGGLLFVGRQSGNTIGSETTAHSILIDATAGSFSGIGSTYATDASYIENNFIGNITAGGSSGAPSIYGIKIKNGSLRRNRIQSLGSLLAAQSPVIYGIHMEGVNGGDKEISNNVLSLDGGNAANPTIYGYYGILNTAGSQYFLYYNTIHIFGSSTTTASTYCYYRSMAGSSILKNNNLANFRSAGGTGQQYGVYLANTAGFTSDYNNLFAAEGVVGYYNSAIRADLTAWRLATGQDAHSISIDPQFQGNNNLIPSAAGLAAGTPIASIITDYLGASRDPINPTI